MGHAELCRKLVELCSCSPLSPNLARNLPIHFACMKTHEPNTHEPNTGAREGAAAVIDALLKHDGYGQAGFRNGQGYQAAHIAAAEGHGSALERVLPIHADPLAGARVPGGFTVLHLAVFAGSVACVAHLIKLLSGKEQANPGAGKLVLDAQDDEGETALHTCAYGDSPEAANLAALLLQAGASREVRSHAGSLPYDVAAAQGQAALMALLQPKNLPPPATVTAVTGSAGAWEARVAGGGGGGGGGGSSSRQAHLASHRSIQVRKEFLTGKEYLTCKEYLTASPPPPPDVASLYAGTDCHHSRPRVTSPQSSAPTPRDRARDRWRRGTVGYDRCWSERCWGRIGGGGRRGGGGGGRGAG